MSNEIDRRWTELCDRWSQVGYASLSRPEKTWLNIRSLIDSIENGGIISYFYNSGADTLGDCLADLTALGAGEVVESVNQVCGLFPNGVPSGMEDRNAAIDSWAESPRQDEIDELLTQVGDALFPLVADLERRLAGHIEQHGLAT
jgi:hypothetical protein